jgi:hypothetical protein
MKRVERARKRREEIKESKRKQVEYEQWQRSLVSSDLAWQQQIREMKAKREVEARPLGPLGSSLFGKLMGF